MALTRIKLTTYRFLPMTQLALSLLRCMPITLSLITTPKPNDLACSIRAALLGRLDVGLDDWLLEVVAPPYSVSHFF